MELLGYAQPCTAHPGETVEVKVSTTQPEFTAEVVRLGADHQPAASPAVRGRFPGQHHDLVGGSYFTAALGEPLPGPAGHAATLWFHPTRLPAAQCLMAGWSGDDGWELGIGADQRVSLTRQPAAGEPRSVSAGPVLSTGAWYFAAASWDAAGAATLTVLARTQPGAAPPSGPDADPPD